ncbi:Nitroreductase [Thermomonospora echinospora]|uniref:Nitroreductase n=1 Tax=Thermomonospora echinospora TaxID=1992 RepID=A0A1H6E2M7_9ACTN|nr:nitroreductase family protein [Thermomonospora echinospora]SEG91872.1 Nitroreductase [Thermomonospora echinospora]
MSAPERTVAPAGLPTTADLDGFPSGVAANETLRTIGTARAMRRLRPDPVPDELIRTLVWAGTRAASPNNSQLWRFVVVRDPGRRAAIGAALERFVRWIDSLGKPADDGDAHIRAEARHLVVNVAQAPVLLFVCAEHSYPERGPDPRYLWSAVNTASQNVLVAARSLGLGATLTMMQVGNEQGVRDVLGLPDDVHIGTMIPVGWPDRPFGPARRRPLDDVIHHDRWRGGSRVQDERDPQ